MRLRQWMAMTGMVSVFGMSVAGGTEAGEVWLPDTGQTGSYTNTFGEDHDYQRPRSYTVNSDGTVTDNVTGLIWQQQNDNALRTWTDAGTYCNALTLAGLSGWRLPSDKELQSLVDYGRYDPSIDTSFFPGTKSAGYWSSSSYAYNSSYAWYVDFDDGNVGSSPKTFHYYVRCVRSGQ